jgi:tetratricopeptide (TPR) repeat protein
MQEEIGIEQGEYMQLGFILAALSGLVGFVGFVHADDGADAAAKEAFDKGSAYHKAQKFDEAADAFERAYQLRPSWKILYNVGQDSAAAKRYGAALEAFERYLVDGGDAILSERKDEVNNEIARLKNMVGYLKVIAPYETIIYVNGVRRGVAPLAGELPVNAVSNQVVRADFEDGSRDERPFSVNSGRTVSVDFTQPAEPQELPPKPRTVVTQSSPTASPTSTSPSANSNNKPNRRRLQIFGWTTFGVGGALLIGGSAVGGLALSMNADLEKSCEHNGCYTENYNQLFSRNNAATSSTVLLTTGGLAAAVGIGLLIVDRVKSKKSESQQAAWLFGPGGLVIQGRF